MKKIIRAGNFLLIALSALFISAVPPKAAAAAGLFGAPQTVSREAGGLNTAIGYWHHEDTYENGAEHKIRQHAIYSQAAYGAGNIWEIYARIGISDLKIFDAFRTADAPDAAVRGDFEENWKFFGTLGAKIFYPFSKTFGMGAFVQGTYSFSNFTDSVSGTAGGAPFTAELKVKNLWDVNLGVGFQAALSGGVRLYAGPYVHYSEAETCATATISGRAQADENVSLSSKAMAGGFAGIDIPLARGFRLNAEGQYSDRLSAGAAVSYTY